MFNKLNLQQYSVSLVLGLVLVLMLVWSWSLQLIVDQGNQALMLQTKQLRESQIGYLQQKQQLWLQSQYSLISTLVKTQSQHDYSQSFIQEYYQRNPNIWSVALLESEFVNELTSEALKPGCLVTDKVGLKAVSNSFLPMISSCHIDGKALLEMSGSLAGSDAVLIISMDYFSFITELSKLTQGKVSPNASVDNPLEFEELANGIPPENAFNVTVANQNQILGGIRLSWQSVDYFDVWLKQFLPVFILLLLVAGAAYTSINRALIRPVLDLAERMYRVSVSQYGSFDQKQDEVKPGLLTLYHYFGALQNMAKHDALTGLNNRIIFEDRLKQALTESKRSGRKYALILMDISNLEDITHRQGQYIADGLIKQFGARLLSALRESDNVSRFDKNIFAALLEVDDNDKFSGLVEKLYLSLVKQFNIHDRNFDITLNTGIAIYPEHGADSDELYHNASLALMKAGDDEWPIVFYTGNDDKGEFTDLTMIQSLRKAIDKEAFKLVFQPVVNLSDHKTVYLEALLRWKEDTGHETSIEKTIQLVEKNNLIKPLTNWIFVAVCQYLQALNIDGLVIGVNLSMIDLHDKKLPNRIEGYLKQYQINPSQIVIEITEGQIMQKPDDVIEILSKLSLMGLSLSIDDFGTGQASLTYLKKLPVEKLKIDQSFVRDIETDPDDKLIVRATIELAHRLGLRVIAEGVETAGCYELLRQMKCDYMQGYYISRPIEADQIASWYGDKIDKNTKLR
ncbi:MAG: diguanylate cyclase (GGDEF)-like protein [Candidatus Azotimanducaceae bacterium]|jgi:diguanylate cyclase (GGDEF)-like protein